LEFRQAVAACMDYNTAVAEIYLDHALRAAVPVNPASWLSTNVPLPGYDMEEARRLLRSALDETESISNIRIYANREDSERVKIAERLADALTEAGLAAYAEALPFEVFTGKLTSGDFEIAVAGYNLSAVPDLRFAFHSSEIETGGNFLRYENSRIDALFGAVNGAFSEQEYMRAAAELQNFFAEDLPVIGLVFRNSAVITDERIKGEIKPAYGNPFANINEWELD
jgi:peptide/nickel transport system substrate-binding protein